MQQSYVGLISHCGLESFWLEQEHTGRFLERRLKRQRSRSCCGYWAVIDDAAARNISALLATGQTQEALLALRYFAEHLGAIIPESLESYQPGRSSES